MNRTSENPMTAVSPIVNDRGDEEHPAFGIATVSRVQGTSRSLFQSDIRHNDTIRLTVSTATRSRSLGQDRVHQDTSIVEVEVSLAQWGQLIASAGLGSGVPVTIVRREGHGLVPEISFSPRTALAVDEVRSATDKLLSEVNDRLADLTEAIEQKQGVKAVRSALHAVRCAVSNAPSNAAFAVKSLEEAAEKVVAQSVSDIEAAALRAASLTGADDTSRLVSGLTAPAELNSAE